MDKSRLKVITAASRRFKRFGFKKTSVDDIALDAGVAKSTLYQHFRSKEELFMSVIVYEAQTAREEVLKRLGEINDPVMRLRRIGELGWDYFNEKPFIVELLSDPSTMLASGLHSEIIARTEGELISILQQAIEDGQQLGKIKNGDAKTMAYLFLKVFQAFTYARTDSLPTDKSRLEQEKQEVLDLLSQAVVKSVLSP